MKPRGQPRRVAVVTGSRAEYGLLASVMDAIAARPPLRLQLVVTGMHLRGKFGFTVRDIQRDGRRIDARIPMQRGDDDPLDQARGISRGVTGIARFLNDAATDIVVVLGDRIEALAGALAAVATGRILAHIHGGDIATGDFDDSLRHAITKLAHLHFPATRAAEQRILRMGEHPARVHRVGAPGLDRLRALLAESAPIRKTPRSALIVHHPIGRSPQREAAVMNRLLRAARDASLNGVIILPNSDRGHSGIVQAVARLHQTRPRGSTNGHPAWRIVPSLPRDEYLRTLIRARVLIGNSSSGIIEAGVAGTAVVNVGSRQNGRDHDAGHVVPCDESRDAIAAAIDRALALRLAPEQATIYGDRPAGPKIAEVLAAVPLTPEFRRKTLSLPDVLPPTPSNGRARRGR